ncbi:pirin family protein [Sphingomonas sp. TDK1]|uniref:pirin family protein n=1 Tax=Sphingomonas sp. TDK1 TaxID=453247 RepID=UPI0007D9134D|nr:pirin family protein [Sphingomonas sp. TDK1]OAN58078.1 nuclease PIN [Sphingomonas sp. TDK1]
MTDVILRSTHPAYRDDIGDLVTRRPVPGPGLEQIGAFLFLNHHGPQTYGPNNRGLPFGPHPHRGFETVTFILEGSLAHTDSAGHESIIRAGGVQWMTAGSGLIHAEISPAEFKRTGGPLEILQLWVNLPNKLKMTAPRYVGLQSDAFPGVAAGEGATVHLVSGDFAGRTGPIESLTGVFLCWAELAGGASLAFDRLANRDLFLYAVEGAVRVGDRALPQWHLAGLSAGDTLTVTADAPARILFGHAAPIPEPVIAHGPFVMSSIEEIRQAYADYQMGKFGVAEIVAG